MLSALERSAAGNFGNVEPTAIHAQLETLGRNVEALATDVRATPARRIAFAAAFAFEDELAGVAEEESLAIDGIAFCGDGATSKEQESEMNTEKLGED